jgi:hypothetical protein
MLMPAAAAIAGRRKGRRRGMSRLLVAALALLVCGVGATGTFAAGNAGTTTVSSEPISFSIPAGQCADLPPDLTVEGTATALVVFHESIDATGNFHTVIETTVTGTATDSAGGTYRFNYHQSQSLSPSADFPFVVTITDHFNLVGAGSANQIHTGFILKVLVTSPTTEELLFFSAGGRGDSSTCDPL